MLLGKLPLARFALERGLECSPYHWLCTEKLGAVLYGLDDLAACEQLAHSMISRDPFSERGALLLRLAKGTASAVDKGRSA